MCAGELYADAGPLEPLYRLAKALPGVPLMRFDLLQCPLPAASIDVLIMLNVLEHIEDDGGALRKAFALLKPGGHLISLEIDLHHAEVARRNLARAGMSDRVEVRVGRASELLDAMQGFVEPFDFIFIDADKASSDVYFKKVLELSHAGTVIIVDNVVRDGKVADAKSEDEDIHGIRRMTEWLGTQPTISATAIQTVGGKSYDGFLMAIVGEAVNG